MVVEFENIANPTRKHYYEFPRHQLQWREELGKFFYLTSAGISRIEIRESRCINCAEAGRLPDHLAIALAELSTYLLSLSLDK